MDWQVGDLAVCVDDGPHPQEPDRAGLTLVRTGGFYRVSGIGVSEFYNCTVLTFDGIDGHLDTSTGFYAAWRFRKIRPDEQEACEPEFVTLIKRSKQRVSA
jgi:hypothetical protein